MTAYRQRPDARLDYVTEWAATLNGDSITSSAWSATPSGLVLDGALVSGANAVIFASGGTSETAYKVKNTVTTLGGRTHVSEFNLRVTLSPPLVTAAALKEQFLPGLPLEDASGRPWKPALIQAFIDSVIGEFEQAYHVRFSPTLVRVGPYSFTNEPATLETGFPGITYRRDEALPDRFAAMHLPVRPAQSVQRIGIRVPGTQTLREFPADWAQVSRTGFLQVSPGSTITVPAFQGSAVTMYGIQSNVPQGWHVLYTAGFTSADLERMPDIAMNMGKLVALALLSPLSVDKYLARGLAGLSVGVDGLSQSNTLLANANRLKFAALADQYKLELDAWTKRFKKRLEGISIGVL